MKKTFEVQIERYYVVTDIIEVEAETQEEAKLQAEDLSDNKDYTAQLNLDHVTSEII